MAKVYRNPRYTTAQTAQAIRSTLYDEAYRNGLKGHDADSFVHAAMSVAAGESSFVDSALNDGSAFGSNEYSIGPWQINMKAHGDSVTPEQAMDPVWSTHWRAPRLLQVWQGMGGAAAFDANPVGFVQKFHPTVQVSITPDAQTVGNSLQTAAYYLGGTKDAQGNIMPPGTTNIAAGSEVGVRPARAGSEVPLRDTTEPPATNFDGILSVIMRRAASGMNSSNPDDRDAAIRLLNAVPALREAYGNADPNTVFQVGAQLGIKREEIEAARNEANADRAFKADQNSLDRAQALAIKSGDWNIAGQQLAEDRRQHEQQYGISLADLGIKNRALDHQIEQDAAQLGVTREELALRRELGMGDLDIRRQSLTQEGELGRGNLDVSRGNLALQGELGRGRLSLDTEAQQQANQLARETLDFNKQQAIISGARSDRQAAMAGLTDLLGTQVRAGEMSSGTAQHALDALLKTWQEAPSTSGYLEGWEPGGINSVLLMRNGGSYDPNNYRVRPFPIDLNSLVNAGSKFDLSQAWQNAVSLMRGEGMLPSQMGNQPFPGASSPGGVPSPTGGATPTTLTGPGGQMSPTPSGGQPAMPSQQPSMNVQQPTNALPGAPAATPPSIPPTQGQTPNTHWAWDGSKWTQVPNAA